MGRVARAGVVCLMLLSVGLARLIEVQLDPVSGATPELRMSPAGFPAPTAPAPASPAAPPPPASTPAPPPRATAPAPLQPPPERTYRIQAGDTLQSIARKVYGTSRGWERILEANRQVIASPTRIRAGVLLKIPPADESPRRVPGTRGA